jgi:regulator of sigma E protease
MNIIVAILIFSVIVVIHELGHFLLAKKNGIFVTEFSVGMGPRLITVVKTQKGFTLKLLPSQKDCDDREDWKDRTLYSLKLLPIGGSCMMLGEDELVDDTNSFNKKSVWARISVVFAGPMFNFLLAFILAMVIVAMIGYDPAEISSVEKGSPVEAAGILPGDIITNIDGKNIDIARELGIYLHFDPLTGEPVDLTYIRDGNETTVTMTPIEKENGSYVLGFGYSPGRNVKTSPLGVVKYGAVEVKFWITTTVKSLGQLVMGKVSKDEIAGPVGIVSMVGGVIDESKQYGIVAILLNIFNMCILLSANLGVMNLLPIPALDGGRLVFLFIEAVRGKPIDQEKEGMVHLIGLVALMILMVFVMFNDISRLFA